jgi:RNA polymerase sigma-70 factor (sigma-E family)
VLDDVAWRSGGHVRFEEYATRQLPTLVRTARAICGDSYLAEDLVQDVLIKLHARWGAISTLSRPDAYVRRMLVNEFLSWRRRWGRLVLVQADPAAGLISDDDFARALAERDALVQEISRLPARQRLVIALRYVADLPDAEIADALGCAESTVRVHAARALATLRVAHAGSETFELVERGRP